MELLDDSLTKMLEHSPLPLSYHIQLDLCNDVALAVAYLHSNGIIHRDLSGNNVLVIAGRRAKVTDFGMSKLAGSDRHLTPLTFCPGTVGYMSPEALKEPPRYTKKLDVFSQGVIMIQVCTRKFPDPGPAMKEVEDPRSPTGIMQMPVLEPERRKQHIDMIDPTHSLLPIAVDCLKYREEDRPTAEELCQRLAALRNSPEYTQSSQQTPPSTAEVITTLQEEHDDLVKQVEESAEQIMGQRQTLAAKDQEIASKSHDILMKNEQIMAKDEENGRLRTQLQELNKKQTENEQVTAEFQETNEELHRQINHLQNHIEDLQRQLNSIPKLPNGPKESVNAQDRTVFRWRDGGRAPFSDWREPSVVDGNVVYFSSHGKVCSYDSGIERWRILPGCPQKWGSLVLVNGRLTMIGGKQTADNKTTTCNLVTLTRWRMDTTIPTNAYKSKLHCSCHCARGAKVS